ncbi:hypothetical protein [Psychroflexus tropicus]|uniref:hypothetical protein n=1 Tax=Psychroflexus tropicus TaxID=197345 RepID=UPI0012F834C1|nr:hypothetical protein [Psychroflexus tropicus]
MKTKNSLMIIGVILLLIIAYFLAIQKTIDLAQSYENLLNNKRNTEEYAIRKVQLEARKDSLQAILGGFKSSSVYLQNKLLVKLDEYSRANKVKIIAIEEPFKFEINEVVVNYFRFTLEGDYASMAKTLHQIETGSNFGEIVSLQFKKEKDKRKKYEYLQAQAILKTSL